MAREEIQNTFTEGLVSDLNPINTPNTALTDCVNGTIITYNGNELSLQNDQGNYPLQYCKLHPNYMPVGVKEYGGILYIASHNPLTGKTQLGSYPAPETITDPDDAGSLVETIGIPSGLYSEIKEEFAVFYGAVPEKLKINPGDQYSLTMSGTRDDYIRTEYFIIDENRKPFDISDKIKLGSSFNYVNWDVPGWLAIKNYVVSPDDFQINVRKVIVPSYGTKAHLKFSLQATGTDKYFLEQEPGITCTYTINVDGTAAASEKNVSLTHSYKIASTQRVFYSDAIEVEVDVEKSSVIEIIATPVIGEITYDNLTKSLTFNVANKGSAEDFTIGEDYWVYYTDKVNNQLVLIFDTGGVDQSSVLDNDVYLYYTIKKVEKDTELESLPIAVSQTLCEEWAMVEDSTIRVPFDTVFVPEDVYIFEFSFYETATLDAGSEAIKTITKLATVTELMNDFNVTDNYYRYDLIPFNKWVTRYFSATQTPEFNVNIKTITPSGNWIDISGTQTPLTMWLKDNTNLPKYSTFQSTKQGSTSSPLTLKKTQSVAIKGSYNNKFKVLTGPLWEDLVTNMTYTSDFGEGVSASPQSTDGQYKQDTSFNKTTTVTATKKYTLEHLGDYYNIWDYDDDVVDYSYADIKITVNAYATSSGTVLEQIVQTTLTRSDGTVETDSTSIKLSAGGQNVKSAVKSFILNELKKTDLMFVRIQLAFVSDNTANSVTAAYVEKTALSTGGYKYKLVDTYGKIENYKDHTEHSEYLKKNFIVFRRNVSEAAKLRGSSDDLLWFPVDDEFDTFTSSMQNYKHLVGISDSDTSGYFVEAVENTDVSTDFNWEYEITGVLHPNSFMYQEVSLFSDTDRATWIKDSWNVEKANFIADISLSTLEDFELTPYVGKVAISGITTPSFSEWDSKIATRNALTKSQQTDYLKDPIFLDGDYTADTNIYYNTTGIDNHYLDALNQEIDIAPYRNKFLVVEAESYSGVSSVTTGVAISQTFLGNLKV